MFTLRLAHEYRTPPRVLLETLTSREVAEEMAYYQLEPWGEDRADLRAAITSATVANCHSLRTLGVEQFMPKFTDPEPTPVEVVKAYFQRLATRTNARH